MEINELSFVEPRWDAPLDPAAALRLVPESATVAGMFIEPLCEHARTVGTPLPSARARYLPFRFYPLREHVQLMLEGCATLFPHRPLRIALRSLGRLAPRSLLTSTIGKVVLGSATNVEQVLLAMIKTYPVHVRPSYAELLALRKGRAVVRLEQIHYFLDSHHVGAFEGALRYAGKQQGAVRVCEYSATAADLLCSWEGT